MKVIKPLNFDQSMRISVNVKRQVKMFMISQILYCEASRNYTIIHLMDGSQYMTAKSLGCVRDMLNHHGFCQIHKSMVVNLQCISSVSREEKPSITLANNKVLMVARRKKQELLKALIA
jgi:two-component system, LytTR family, response regulator